MRLRLALALCLVLSACSGDDSGSKNTVPSLPWGLFRHDINNTGAGNSINQNRGEVVLLATGLGDLGISTPTIDNEFNVFLGTRDGALSVDKEGKLRWRITNCIPEDGAAFPIGSVSSSLTVQAGGNVIFGSDGSDIDGAVFYLKEKNDEVTCEWAFQPSAVAGRSGVSSSAQVQIDPNDLSLLGVFLGADNGRLNAINGIGTPRWSYPGAAAARGRITSTPAVGNNSSTYITTPEGLLLGVDSGGRPLSGNSWPAIAIGVPPAAPLQQSASVNVSIYAIGAGSALNAINPSGTLKWQYSPQADVLGSQAFISQSVDDGPDTVFDTIVYIVDREGTLYGIRDQTGQILAIQRCTKDTERSCRTDSCDPELEGTCMGGKCSISHTDCTQDSCISDNKGSCEILPVQRCSTDPGRSCTADSCDSAQGTCTSGKCSVSQTNCTPDSCIADDDGTCETIGSSGLLPITGGTVEVRTSPVVSGDLFAIVGTGDGHVCARALDDTVPGDKDNPSNPWIVGNGCIYLGDGLPVLSSPVIGPNSRIYVTTATGIYVIE